MWHLLSAPLKSCWKVGNARLYNATLYGHLATSIPLLVANLRDSDPKTRANAAGALGNLARNGSRLCAELMKSGAPVALLAVALTVLSPPSRRARPERSTHGALLTRSAAIVGHAMHRRKNPDIIMSLRYHGMSEDRCMFPSCSFECRENLFSCVRNLPTLTSSKE